MQLKKVVFIPELEIEFSRAEITALMEASAAHYDSTCRKAGQIGGFLYGIKNQLFPGKNSNDTTSARLTWGQVNLLAKIAEQLSLTHRSQPAFVASLTFGPQSFSAFLRKLSEEYERVNKP